MKKNSGANLPIKDFPYFSYIFFNHTCTFVLNKYVLMIMIILEIHLVYLSHYIYGKNIVTKILFVIRKT